MISIQHIWKSFGDKTVLQDVTLEVREGETLAIIGRSGSGKSVMMKHMIGLLQPDRGRVLVDGTDINNISYTELREVRQNFGVLFQGGALFDSMNAFDNVAFPLRTFTRLPESEVEKEVLTSLRMVELEDVGPKMPAELSGGMKKRVALARAVAMKPRYILYDEPTSGLDPETSNTIDQLIKGLADVVYGSRFTGGGPHRVLYFWHSVGNKLLTLFSNALTDLNLTDMETGYKAFRR